MADAKITALAELTNVADEDLLAVVDDPSGSPQTKKITRANLLTGVGGGRQPNALINGGFDIAQRMVAPTTAVSMTDDTYESFDRWYSLVQGSGATIERVSGDQAQYAAKMIAGGTTNRFGIATILEASDSIPYRGRGVRFSVKVRPNLNAGSGNMDVRVAILEWTGTADSVTSDFVNDWTSATYTTGNFFTSTSTTVTGVATSAVAHNTWTTVEVTGTVSSSCNNLVVMVWHEDVPAHANDYLEVSEAQLHDGTTSQDWLPKPKAAEEQDCLRYCFVPDIADAVALVAGVMAATNTLRFTIPFPITMRADPSGSHNITAYAAAIPTTTQANSVKTSGGLGNVTVTGGLSGATVAAGGRNTGRLDLAAGTSWSETVGDLVHLRLGPSVRVVYSAEL